MADFIAQGTELLQKNPIRSPSVDGIVVSKRAILLMCGLYLASSVRCQGPGGVLEIRLEFELLSLSIQIH